MAVTIKDIANIAGVSYSTVSRCLNDSDLVSSKTKKKIKKIAEDLEFEFNVSARSLTTNKKGIIGVVYPHNYDSFGVYQYYSSLHNELRKSLEKKEMDLIITFLENRTTGKNNIKRLITQQKVDGLMIAEPNIDLDTLMFLKQSKIPFIFFHQVVNEEWDDIDVFYMDHFRGGYLATKHLLKLGCKSIATITSDGKEFNLRTEGYKGALSEHGITLNENLIYNSNLDFIKTTKIVENNIKQIKKVDGIFVQNDLMAWATMETLKLHGINIPKDIAIIGYDDIEVSSCITPKLTTIHQPREEISIVACNRLLELINKKKKSSKRIIFNPRIVIRESCGTNKSSSATSS